eukprot:4980751-Amphidinium_carterae.1
MGWRLHHGWPFPAREFGADALPDRLEIHLAVAFASNSHVSRKVIQSCRYYRKVPCTHAVIIHAWRIDIPWLSLAHVTPPSKVSESAHLRNSRKKVDILLLGRSDCTGSSGFVWALWNFEV